MSVPVNKGFVQFNFKYELYMVCLDGGVLKLNITNAKTRKHIICNLLDYNKDAEIWSKDAIGLWFKDTMEETMVLTPEPEIPNWLKAYLLIHEE